MTKSKSLTAVFIVAFLAGCIPLSLNPFYSEKDLTFDPNLIGLWGDKDEGGQVRFDKAGERSYVMSEVTSDSATAFEVHLFTLEGKLFLDLYPSSTGVSHDDLLEMHLIRGHSLARVDQVDSILVTAVLSEDWLKDLFKSDSSALPHMISNDQVVLTASTDQLRSFVLKHLADSAAFESPSEMVRVVGK